MQKKRIDKHTEEQLEKLHSMRLSDARRARMRGELEGFADFHPVRGGPVRVGEEERLKGYAPNGAGTQASFLAIFSGNYAKIMGIALIIAILVSGGTTFAAQGAVPGDALYPVKIHVNENVRSAVAVSNESEARLQATFVEERLEEAQELAAEGRLDAEASATVESNLKARFERATKETATLESNGKTEAAAEVRARLNAAFRTYAEVFGSSDVQAKNEGAANVVTNLETLVNINSNAGARTDQDANAGINVDGTLDVDSDGLDIQVGSESQSGTQGSAGSDSNTNTESNTDTSVQGSGSVSGGASTSAEADANSSLDVQL